MWLISTQGQYSVFKVDYRGYAYLQKGDKGVCKATYYFSGVTQQVSSALTLTGPYDDNYLKTDQFGIETTVWSPCGQEGYLNVNSEVRLTPIDNKKTALLTVGAPSFRGPWTAPWEWWQGPTKHSKKNREIVSSNHSPVGRFHRSQVLPGPLPPVAEVLSHLSLIDTAPCSIPVVVEETNRHSRHQWLFLRRERSLVQETDECTYNSSQSIAANLQRLTRWERHNATRSADN